MDFLRRQEQRRRFRRPWAAWVLLVGAFLVARWIFLPPLVELFQGMNLSLPLPTRLLIEPPWLWGLLLSSVPCWWPRFHEERLEAEAHLCWIMARRDELPYHLAVMFEAARVKGNLRATALDWARGIEWDLENRQWRQRWRRVFVLFWFGVFAVGGVLLALGLPLYQLVG